MKLLIVTIVLLCAGTWFASARVVVRTEDGQRTEDAQELEGFYGKIVEDDEPKDHIRSKRISKRNPTDDPVLVQHVGGYPPEYYDSGFPPQQLGDNPTMDDSMGSMKSPEEPDVLDANQSGPVLEELESGPAPQESVPAPDEIAPAPEESAPALEEYAPAPEESAPAPAPEEIAPAPAPEELAPAPAPEESAPAPEEPAPPLAPAPAPEQRPMKPVTAESRKYIQYCQAPEGQFPHPNYCNRYVNCYYGFAALQDCPTGTSFSAETNQCDFKRTVDCGERNYAQASFELCELPNRYYSNPSNCSEFFVCNGKIPFRMSCPETLNYNQEIGVCDYPYRAACVETRTQNSRSSRQLWVRKRRYRGITLKLGLIDTDIKCEPNSVQIITKNCSEASVCNSEGVMQIVKCPPYTAFDKESKKCVAEKVVKC